MLFTTLLANNRRKITFDAGGDSETLLRYNEKTGSVQEYWIRSIAFPNRAPLFYVIDRTGEEISPVMTEPGMQLVIDGYDRRLVAYLHSLADLHIAASNGRTI